MTIARFCGNDTNGFVSKTVVAEQKSRKLVVHVGLRRESFHPLECPNGI